MIEVRALEAYEILDSRGRPTVLAACTLASGARGTASVPSGASTGSAEAHELRDGDSDRHGGLGCRRAVANVNGEISKALVGRRLDDHAALDHVLIDLDGTSEKSRLGANAILATSLAVARAGAVEAGVPLYQHLAVIGGNDEPLDLPRPTVNLFSGGKHAGGQMPLQDVLVTPMSATTVDEAMAMVSAVFRAAVERCAERYGMRALVADEGGLAPAFARVEDAFEDAVAAIEMAGFTPGRDVALCIDLAASHFFEGGKDDGVGVYAIDGRSLTSGQMIDVIDGWVDRYPIVSLEDGLAEDDWAAWPALRERIGDRALVLGDDLLATNPARIARAVPSDAATAHRLKVNQIGTLTEAAEALRLAKAAGWAVVVSARSGETEDDWLADLAVGWGGDQLKVGSITRSERLAKWNRLLVLEAQTGLPLRPWPRARDSPGTR